MEQFIGLLHNVGVEQTFGSDATMVEFVATRTTGGSYPNVAFQVMGKEMIAKLRAIEPNSLIKVDYQIHSTPGMGKNGLPKYYTNLRAYNITLIASNSVIEPTIENTPAVIEQKVEVEKAD